MPKSFNQLIKVIIEIKNDFSAFIKPNKIEGIGFSVAGSLDKERRKVLNSYNIPYLNGKLFLQIFKRKFSSYPVAIEHDVHCFLLAESKIGVAKKYTNVFYLTLGTGIGGAFTIDGKIITGSHGAAGEIGHSIVDFEKSVRWEDVAASKYIKSQLGIFFSEAKEKASRGDKRVLQAFMELGENLGVGIANIINIFDPEVIIINGGLASAKELISPGIKKGIEKYVISPEARKTKIIWSKLGRFGGALGAALMFETCNIKHRT